MPDLNMILARDGSGERRLWACRGEGKGCKRNRHRTSRKPCPDCFGPLDENMTLEQVQQRLTSGDA